MIVVCGLEKRYGDYRAVTNISFSAQKGDVVGFLGPNGAGKTTTIRMLATFLAPTAGTASVAGFDILRDSDQVRRRIGYLPEMPPLYGGMRVREYLRFAAEIRGLRGKEIARRVDETIERCFLSNSAHKLCQNLSRGYRQRVGIAQAIVHNPEVMILDEPTSGLDPRQIIDIRNLIAELASEHTVILSTHILQEVSVACNKVVIISEGLIVLESYLRDLAKGQTLEQVFMQAITATDPARGDLAQEKLPC